MNFVILWYPDLYWFTHFSNFILCYHPGAEPPRPLPVGRTWETLACGCTPEAKSSRRRRLHQTNTFYLKALHLAVMYIAACYCVEVHMESMFVVFRMFRDVLCFCDIVTDFVIFVTWLTKFYLYREMVFAYCHINRE